MSPSSLIFVAVVASWTIYLVIHVARRREQLATARNVDRFSSQMRVLQRRAVANVNVESTGRLTPTLLAARSPLRAEPTYRAAETSAARPVGRHVEGHTVIAAEAASAGPVRVEHTKSEAERRRGLLRNRVRGAVLLLSVLSAVITGALAAFALVPWYVPVAFVALSALTVVAMRAAALRRRSARTRAAAARHREHDREARLRRENEHAQRPAASEMPVAQEFVPVRDEVFDLSVHEPAIAAPEKGTELADPLFAENGWDPTPVPPPTYTLKAKAYRPLPPPAETTEVPVPIEIDEDDVAWNESTDRRSIRGA